MSTISVSLTQEQFEQYIHPTLSVAKRGCTGSIALYKVFNDNLYRLDTGCHCERLPIANNKSDPTKTNSAIKRYTITTSVE
jgi:hypothetical protein